MPPPQESLNAQKKTAYYTEARRQLEGRGEGQGRKSFSGKQTNIVYFHIPVILTTEIENSAKLVCNYVKSSRQLTYSLTKLIYTSIVQEENIDYLFLREKLKSFPFYNPDALNKTGEEIAATLSKRSGICPLWLLGHQGNAHRHCRRSMENSFVSTMGLLWLEKKE